MLEYKMKLRLSEDDLDDAGNVKAASLLHFFQEVASADVKRYGFGTDDLIKENLIWVLTKLKYKMYGKLSAEETYTLVTCPRPKSSRAVTYKRDYYIYDKSGAVLVAGGSQWCILNFETRKITRVELDFDGEYRSRDAFEEGIEKIHSDAPVLAGKHTVTAEDIDENQHTNNCRYVDMISGVTGRTDYSDFVINFAKETRLGDEILIYKETDAEADSEALAASTTSHVVIGKLVDGTVVFQAKLK